MQRITLPCLAMVAALAASCTAPDANKTAPATTVNEIVNDSGNVSAAADVAVTNDCAKVTTKDWKAWVDTMPGPGSSPTLHVTGQATTPTSGWTVVLNQGPLDKALPPTQHFTLVATAPTGPVQQVITTQEVKAEIRNSQPKYKAVAISCGDTGIATIPVEVVS
ncbi:hypothetical protein J2W22_000712 [Sphingomonas kyeonggiensis]|uniref:hypothetical protein n=1 Tax=Sphingomonas kyeonggiensis TaxID=1268553 RepID=UPI002785648D|nr:hypothetical protein [Sphingomonas kyeonggiensis]MDQ0248665.1 hypothetical protein [Sphingomonas kyeonggiensis]